MTEYETSIATMLQAQYGAEWYYHGAHSQTLRDYVTADSDATRDRARNTMKRDAIFYAVGVIQAARHAGMVTLVAD